MPTPRSEWSERSQELSRLLARAGAGDRAAFAALYEKTSAHLLGVVLRTQRDRAQAEDVLQEPPAARRMASRTARCSMSAS